MTESFRQWGQGRFHYGKFETIGTEKTSGMKVRDNGTGKTSRWEVWDSWDREDFRMWSLRQQGQGGLQDGKFETIGMEKTSGQGVWNNGDREDFRMGNLRQLGQRRLRDGGGLRQWGQGGLQDGKFETIGTEKTSGLGVWDWGDRKDFRMGCLRQLRQSRLQTRIFRQWWLWGLQDWEFETIRTEKHSGWGVWDSGDRGGFRMGRLRQSGQRRLQDR